MKICLIKVKILETSQSKDNKICKLTVNTSTQTVNMMSKVCVLQESSFMASKKLKV